jgi:hypothetical protein
MVFELSYNLLNFFSLKKVSQAGLEEYFGVHAANFGSSSFCSTYAYVLLSRDSSTGPVNPAGTRRKMRRKTKKKKWRLAPSPWAISSTSRATSHSFHGECHASARAGVAGPDSTVLRPR